MRRAAGCLTLVGGGAAAAAFTYCASPHKTFEQVKSVPLLVQCSKKLSPQSSVINDTKQHALFLTIHLNPSANVQECLKALGHIQLYVDKISPPDLRDETDEIWYGVGFGPDYMVKISDHVQGPVVPYPYRTRSGALGGDIFIHAKCNERGKLFELAQAVIDGLPQKSVSKFEDVYGWVYRNGRDLSGFIDGTENPASEDDRVKVAIDPQSGASYAITQRWVHNYSVIKNTKGT
ncbi:unnamed protein product [Echinostoma caproni]|uniref:Dyp-type peroxidase n=1 Tax=Echinostoma caproni TaxID=27848 RepID=A0A183AYZ6_9TREM|nr:unnamed protein product [Echinostoma caproni]